MKVIETSAAPKAMGHYSQGIITGNLVFTAGQIGVDPATGIIPEGITPQAHLSCKNVGGVLTSVGSGYEKVVKATCFLADMKDFAAFNEVYSQYFVSKPARSCVAVRELPKGALCEIEVVAEI